MISNMLATFDANCSICRPRISSFIAGKAFWENSEGVFPWKLRHLKLNNNIVTEENYFHSPVFKVINNELDYTYGGCVTIPEEVYSSRDLLHVHVSHLGFLECPYCQANDIYSRFCYVTWLMSLIISFLVCIIRSTIDTTTLPPGSSK